VHCIDSNYNVKGKTRNLLGVGRRGKQGSKTGDLCRWCNKKIFQHKFFQTTRNQFFQTAEGVKGQYKHTTQIIEKKKKYSYNYIPPSFQKCGQLVPFTMLAETPLEEAI
jgi:hypothetical protein